MRQETGRKRETRDGRQEVGHRRWDTGDGRQAREGVQRQETGDMVKTGDRRRETGLHGRQCSDIKSGCTKIELLLFWKKKS